MAIGAIVMPWGDPVTFCLDLRPIPQEEAAVSVVRTCGQRSQRPKWRTWCCSFANGHVSNCLLNKCLSSYPQISTAKSSLEKLLFSPVDDYEYRHLELWNLSPKQNLYQYTPRQASENSGREDRDWANQEQTVSSGSRDYEAMNKSSCGCLHKEELMRFLPLIASCWQLVTTEEGRVGFLQGVAPGSLPMLQWMPSLSYTYRQP